MFKFIGISVGVGLSVFFFVLIIGGAGYLAVELIEKYLTLG